MTEHEFPCKSSLLDASTDPASNEVRIYQLLKRLCITACPPIPRTASADVKQQQQQLIDFMFNHSLQQLTLGSRLPRTLADEGAVVRRVQKNLIQQKRDSTTALFSESVSKLDKRMKSPEMRYSLLSFLLRMMDDAITYHNSTIIPDLSSTLSIHKMGILSDINLSNVTSGISLGFDSTASTTMHQQSSRSISYKPEESHTSSVNNTRNRSNRNRNRSSPKRLDGLSWYMAPFSHLEYGPTWKICEQDLVRDLIFIFQGASGTHILWENTTHRFYFIEEIRLPTPIHCICMKLAELGKLYQKVNLFVTDNMKDPQKPGKPAELLVHAFKTALKDHLFEYYRFISVLDEKLHREAANPEEPPLLSLKRLMVWSYEPLQCFQMLSKVLDECYNLSGCKLMNKVYEFSRTGHPEHAILLNSILGKLFSPFKSVLDKWLYEGDLPNRAISQFFIMENQANLPSEDIWEKKYELLKDQVPSFISDELALKVMVTGKSINFLKEKCQEHKLDVIFNLVDTLKNAEDETFDSLIDGRVENRIREAYEQTCFYLLNVLKDKFHFYEHLKAMRRYLLLGQGDFIRMLMELLYDDLERDGKHILKHNLMTLMGDAVRATNARFDESYIIDQLDITLMPSTGGEKGWDIFSLFYHFKPGGPLICIFSMKVMISYLKIFNFIWRAQRTEFLLSKAWKNLQACDRKWAQSLDLGEVFHLSHKLISAMIHFTRQVHYYLSSEVLACSWEELQARLLKATDLDQLREAHQSFLTTVSTHCFVKIPSMTEEECYTDNELSIRHRGISDEVVKYISILDDLYVRCEAEKHRRHNFRLKANIGSRSGVIDVEEREERLKFHIAIEENISPNLRIISSALMRFLWGFVRGLKGHRNPNMRLFATRLDFNGFFQRFDPDAD
ncbi:hypothetical protein LOD99_2664 [Oopsacas minuta]|uniref:Gamma-tubulin complex component n=1 Tax=Oopsacas minuta TaxID=111878 RepID=A0AAV7K1Z9_9METZ|nr:hypothetical protein LOD99_2664 [Oopsacas minuta]